MIRLACLLLFALPTALPAEDKKPDAKADLAALKGKWKVTAAKFDGKELAVPGDQVLVFDEKEFTRFEGKKKGRTIGFVLDPSADPKRIDLTLPGTDQKAFIDVDSTHKRVYGRTKQGAEHGRFKGVRTLHPLLATLSTPTSRPVIATVQMRRGKAGDPRGAARPASQALATAGEAGCTGMRLLRADSAFYNADVIAAWSVLGARGRGMFRRALDVDDDTWNRARAYALHQALMIVPYYPATNPAFVAMAKRTIAEILASPS